MTKEHPTYDLDVDFEEESALEEAGETIARTPWLLLVLLLPLVLTVCALLILWAVNGTLTVETLTALAVGGGIGGLGGVLAAKARRA